MLDVVVKGVVDVVVVVVVVVVDFSVETVSSDCLKTKIARKLMISITALENVDKRQFKEALRHAKNNHWDLKSSKK